VTVAKTQWRVTILEDEASGLRKRIVSRKKKGTTINKVK
jgi:hypothetical protein